jgi:hypothetical protein
VTTYETITAGLAIFGAVTSLGALVFVGLQVMFLRTQVRQAATNQIDDNEARRREWHIRHREASFRFYMDSLELRTRHHLHLPADRDSRAIARFLTAGFRRTLVPVGSAGYSGA